MEKQSGLGRSASWRNLLIAACVGVASLWTSAASATITQGDFSVYGFFESRESGRWGEGGAKDGTGKPATYLAGTPIQTSPGLAASESGGSFDFNHWDLVQARQLADVRPDYHIVKNYKLLGRFDTVFLKDADFFAFYRPWYDAFSTLKQEGRDEPNRDWPEYTQRDRQQEYFRDDLREYYVQLNFTDSFSARVGKQQVIWSEADALSGTEVTNPSDLSYHWTHFESAENLRKNVRMVKLNYILPDFLKTTNNEMEAFWIPGDYQGDSAYVQSADMRSPWIVYVPESANPTAYNHFGQPFRQVTLADAGYHPNTAVALSPGTPPVLLQEDILFAGERPRNAILKNSEFGARYSTLLPIGSGLQTSFIYLYEMRDDGESICSSCKTPSGFVVSPVTHTRTRVKYIKADPGVFLGVGQFDFGPPPPGAPIPLGTLRVDLSINYRKNHFFGLTGTYYDKDLTDIVYRYDALYAPKTGVNQAPHNQPGRSRGLKLGTSGFKWTEQARFILAADRPTYIPWISKQHTFLVAQYVNTWFPDEPDAALANIADAAGKLRAVQSLFFVAAVNWVDNGQLTTTNTFVWDADDRTGEIISTNVFRYSRNILLGLNAQWYLGQSGRFTDPVIFSRDQRISELEATFTYEI